MKSVVFLLAGILLLLSTVACSQRANDVSYKDNVKKALEQADLKDVTVDEDRDKNTITLHGKLHSENAKQQAGEIAQVFESLEYRGFARAAHAGDDDQFCDSTTVAPPPFTANFHYATPDLAGKLAQYHSRGMLAGTAEGR